MALKGTVMQVKTFESTLRKFNRRVPFSSFIVELVSGSRIKVEHPEALAFGGGAAVYINPSGEFTFFDHEGVSRITDEKGLAKSP